MAEVDENTPLLRSGRSAKGDNPVHVMVPQPVETLGSLGSDETRVALPESRPNENSFPNGRIERNISVEKIYPISLSWKNVSVSVKIPAKKKWCSRTTQKATEKSILKNVSGLVNPGTLVAIMGASGAGKSTLLNVLTSRNTKNYVFNGDIRVNGWHIGSSIKGISAYVQQDDLFITTLTVREQLQFRALLRMDKKLDKASRLARVEDVIVEMGLTKCANNRIGDAGGGKKGISGGERKRLSFASEALTNPPIFFCDEPTSGLDSFMAQNIITTLQKMASKGRVILCTIHQPSSELFSMFDQILLLAEGRTAFMGTQRAAMDFFHNLEYPCPNNYNPADHFILTLAIVPGQEAECRQRTHAVCDKFCETEEYIKMVNQAEDLTQTARHSKTDPLLNDILAGESRYEVSWLTQFRYLFWRSWISMFRDVILTRVRIMQALTLAIVLGLIYLQQTVDQKGIMSINGAIFLLITNTSFSNMFAVVNSFPLELSIFLREYGTGLYRVDTYYLTKTIAEVPLFVAVSIIFATITYWMIGLYGSLEAYLIAVGILVLVANVAISLGYLISTLCGSVTVSLAVAPPLLIPIMLFGGLFVNNGNIPVYFIWLQYLSWFKFSNEVLMVNQWRNIDYIPCPNITIPTIPPNITTPSVPSMPQCLYRSGKDVLDYTSFSEDNLVLDIILLVVLQVGFRFLSIVALFIRARRSKE
ncbi:protein white-like [Biomphalaria glabrata]|uniref:Protein white-like n=2 Tax=Biomphalaria glabrata TaxID=6526 RepID=A0A9W2ZEW1_BIOGL|nr:protein white-like [Biomphalaria glabrata]XP_055873629.1 protein white-like [Biomphalaria glabrata]XP_055873636.1 protein white-like [Biomphalaria glabrata]KAI8777535.1 protein white [Biomphalaria glabrata]